MNSEKVKELKEFIETSAELGCFYKLANCEITMLEVFEYINELESENERLSKELDIEWKDRRKAEEDLRKAQWNYKIGLGQSRKRNKELKDRIAELEGEITKLDIINSKLEMDIELLNKQNIDLEIDRDYYQEQFNEQEDFYVEWNKQQLKQFAEKVAKRLINIKGIKEILDETLKEFI